MKRVAFFLCLLGTGCVDGKTPDCTEVDSGCYPGDTGSPVVDSGSDASSDASDASPDVVSSDAAADAPID